MAIAASPASRTRDKKASASFNRGMTFTLSKPLAGGGDLSARVADPQNEAIVRYVTTSQRGANSSHYQLCSSLP